MELSCCHQIRATELVDYTIAHLCQSQMPSNDVLDHFRMMKRNACHSYIMYYPAYIKSISSLSIDCAFVVANVV